MHQLWKVVEITSLRDESILLYDQNKVTLGWATSAHRARGSWISILVS